jgi:hypothetical protein
MLTPPTIDDLAAFTGRPAATFGPFATAALEQSALMFSIVTQLSDYPEDPDQAKLASFAIMELADRLVLEQPYQSISASPFQTETIGSYSYSRVTQTSLKVQAGARTGLYWWDLAVDQLTQPGQSLVANGGVHVYDNGIVVDPNGGWMIENPHAGADRPPYIRIS